MRKKKTNIGLYASLSFSALVLVIAIAMGVSAYSGNAGTVMENVNIEKYNDVSDGEEFGAVVGPNVYMDMVFHGTVKEREPITAVAQTGATTTLTLVAADSGSTYVLSATGTWIVLPSVAYTGAHYRFQVNGAMGIADMEIQSAEGDNIEGTLIVAGAVVDCDAEDQVNFIVDGENLGDYFEIMSDGTQWLLGDSGVLSSSKLTCTDPS